MSTSLSTADRTAIEAIVTSLQDAWNAADGTAFAAPFMDDADFVNVRADHHHGRAAIASGHDAILRSIYAGSSNSYRIRTVRALNPDVALVHVDSRLDVPGGPLAGAHRALFSAVMMRTGAGWQIASFHNTLVPPPMPRP